MKGKHAALAALAALSVLSGCLDEAALDELLEEAELWEEPGQLQAAELSEASEAVQASETSSDAETAQESETEETNYSYEAVYTFRNDDFLEQHFEKHGAEFGYASEQEYVDGANSVIVSADALHKTEAEDGDDIYYIEETNEFVVVSADGYIRTYFKPSRGIDYYYEQ